MSAQIIDASEALRTARIKPLTDNRIGSLVQVNARTEADDEGNLSQVRVEVDRHTFVSALPLGIRELVPPLKDPHKALRAAITRAKKGVHEVGAAASDRRPQWTRLGKFDSGVLVYALSVARVDASAAEVRTGQVANVRVSETGAFDVEWKTETPSRLAKDQVEAVQKRYEKERNALHSDDVRTFINNLLTEQKAVGIGGMLHLVPREGDQRVQDAKPALVAAGYTVLVKPIAEGGDLAEEVTGGLMQEVARLSARVRRMSSDLNGGKDIQLGTFDSRLDEARSLRARAEMFAELVGSAEEDVGAALVDVEQIIRQAQLSILTSIEVGS